jgi:hypothetical protein
MALPTISTLPTAPAVSDDSATFNTRAFALVAALSTLVSELNSYGAALPATVTGTDFSATSTTSLTIGTGSKALTVQTGKQFQIGQPVRIAYTVTPSNYMDGQVTAYNSSTGALTVSVSSVGGAGTQADWTISLIPGAGGNFVTLTGAETLTNKTLTAPTISTITNGGTITVPTGTLTLASRTGTETLTNKTLALGSNTVSGTIAQFNTACTDADFATLSGTETLANKTINASVLGSGSQVGSSLVDASNTVTDSGTIAVTSPGFRGIPQNAQTAAYQIVLADAGKHISITTGGITVPANASLAFPVGSTIVIFNNSGSSQTIAITSDTMRLAGTASTGSRTLAQYGLATLVKVNTTEWAISGAGLS